MRSKTQKGAGKLNQDEHVDCALARATMEVLAPGEVITPSTDWIKIGQGCLVRVEVTAETYIAFAEDTTGGATTVATSPAVKLPIGYHVIRATETFMRASLAPARIEVLY